MVDALPTTNTVFRGLEGKATNVPVDLPAELKPKEILLKMTHASICGTDVHMLGAGCALGHEGVGIVVKVGSEVQQFKVGDRAGAGYLRNSCGHCRYCLKGEDIWCYERDAYGFSNFNTGTFTEYYIGTETFLHRLPDNMASEHAAPLQCAGATVYSALISTLYPGARVGIIGIGGLGHLAIQFAAKMGHDVVVFSTTKGKEEEARGFGATEFYLLGEVEKLSIPVDILLVAGSKYPNWEAFMTKTVLARNGTVVPLAAPMENFSLPSFPMFFDGYHLHSNLVASRGATDDMIAFAAKHDVKPVVELFEFSEKGAEEAFKRLGEGKLRYRGVLVRKE